MNRVEQFRIDSALELLFVGNFEVLRSTACSEKDICSLVSVIVSHFCLTKNFDGQFLKP